LKSIETFQQSPYSKQSKITGAQLRETKAESHVSRHDVHFIERFRAVGTFSHAVGDSIFHAVVAEKMAASLKDGVFEVRSTDGT